MTHLEGSAPLGPRLREVKATVEIVSEDEVSTKAASLAVAHILAQLKVMPT